MMMMMIKKKGGREVQDKVRQMRNADLSDLKMGPKFSTPIPLNNCVPFHFQWAAYNFNGSEKEIGMDGPSLHTIFCYPCFVHL